MLFAVMLFTGMLFTGMLFKLVFFMRTPCDYISGNYLTASIHKLQNSTDQLKIYMHLVVSSYIFTGQKCVQLLESDISLVTGCFLWDNGSGGI